MEAIANEDWEVLLKRYAWVRDMQQVPQSPIHHAEGDVATHTRMVLGALKALPEFKALDPQTQEIVRTAALLHDVEKRSTTFQGPTGNIVSPGHAKEGALTARQLLMTEFKVPFTTREAIVALVRYHGLPLWVLHKPDPLKALLGASLAINTRWLAMLAKADVLGRICADQAELLERVAFFEAYCQEQGCWGQPYPFATDAARFEFFQKADGSPLYVPFEQPRCTATLLCGLPGMGKDFYSRQYLPEVPVVSLDAIRRKHHLKPEDSAATGWVVQQAKEAARVHLRARQDFVWNATNVTRNLRSQLIALFAAYGARIRIVYVERSLAVWHQQNAAREHTVPVSVLHRFFAKLEVPTPDEAHEVIYHVV